MHELGVDADEAAAIVAAIQHQQRPHNMTGYLRTLASRGDLADWQGQVREQASRQQTRLAADHRRTAPPCPHGEPGGDQLHPRSGRPWCALCRAGIPAETGSEATTVLSALGTGP